MSKDQSPIICTQANMPTQITWRAIEALEDLRQEIENQTARHVRNSLTNHITACDLLLYDNMDGALARKGIYVPEDIDWGLISSIARVSIAGGWKREVIFS